MNSRQELEQRRRNIVDEVVGRKTGEVIPGDLEFDWYQRKAEELVEIDVQLGRMISREV